MSSQKIKKKVRKRVKKEKQDKKHKLITRIDPWFLTKYIKGEKRHE